MHIPNPPQQRVARKAPAVWAISAALLWLVLIGIAVAVGLIFSWWPPLVAWVVALGLMAIHVFVIPPLRFRIYRWDASPDALVTQIGWLSIELRLAPMSRVQTVDYDQGPIARLFGLATVTATTASSEGPVEVRMIPRDAAKQLVQDLGRWAAASGDDAT